MGGSIIQQAFSRFGRHIFDITAEFERLRLGLAALEGNTFIADEQLARLRRLADLPGIGFTQGIRAFTGLRGAGINQDLSIRLYREIANVATLSGATQEDISENLRQFRQIFSARAFTQQDVRPIIQRNPLIQRAFIQEFGSIQAGDINAFLERNNLTIEQAFERLVSNLEQGPRAAADTLQNSIEILRDAFDDLARDIGRDLLPVFRDLVQTLTRLTRFARTPGGRVVTAGLAGAGVGAAAAAGLGISGLLGGFTVGSGIAGTAAAFNRNAFTIPRSVIEDIGVTATGGEAFAAGRDYARARGAGRFNAFRAGAFTRAAAAGGALSFIGARRIPLGGILGPLAIGATTGIAAQLANNAVQRVVFGEDYNAFDQILSVIGGGPFLPVDGGPIRARVPGGRVTTRTQALNRLGPFEARFTQALEALNREATPENLQRYREALLNVNTAADQSAAFLRRERENILADQRRILRLGQGPDEPDRAISDLSEAELDLLRTRRDEYNLVLQLEEILGRTNARRQESIDQLEGERAPQRTPAEIRQDIQAASDAFRAEGGGQVTPESFRGPGSGAIELTDGTIIPNQFIRGRLPPPGDTRGISLPDYEVDPVTGEARRIGRRAAIPRGRQLIDPGLPQRGGTIFPNLPQGFQPESLNNIFSLRVQELIGRGQRPGFPYVPGLTSIIPQVAPIPDITDPLAGFDRTRADRADPLFGANRLLQGTTPDAGRLRGLVGNVRDLLDEWEAVNVEVDRFTGQFEGPSYDRILDIVDVSLTDNLFTPEAVRTAENTRRELEDMSATLERFADDIRSVEGVPQRLQDRLEQAARQIEEDIDRLDRLVEYARALERDQREDEIDRRIREQVERDRDAGIGLFAPPPTEEQARRAYETLPGVRRARAQERQRAQAISGYFEGAGESLYDQFVAPSILDAIGIGSAQGAQQERAIENLNRSIREARREVRENELLNERQQAEQLLEINREYEAEKREIERSYEEERRDAWANWVRQQLIDFPKLIFQQLNLQLAARATNSILNSLNLGGNVPITGPGIGGQASGFLQNIGLGGQGGGAGLAGTAATVGTAASFLLAGHNVVSGIRAGLFDDIGQDVGNIFNDIQNATGNNSGQRLVADVGLTVDDVRVFSNKQTELRLEDRV